MKDGDGLEPIEGDGVVGLRTTIGGEVGVAVGFLVGCGVGARVTDVKQAHCSSFLAVGQSLHDVCPRLFWYVPG